MADFRGRGKGKTAFQKAVNKQMPREERIALVVTLARGVKAIRKKKGGRPHKRGEVGETGTYFVELQADEEVYTTAPSESALAKLNEWAEGKGSPGGAGKGRGPAVIVQVMEADIVDDLQQAGPPKERDGEGFPDLPDLDDTNDTEAEAVTPDTDLS